MYSPSEPDPHPNVFARALPRIVLQSHPAYSKDVSFQTFAKNICLFAIILKASSQINKKNHFPGSVHVSADRSGENVDDVQ
jgi:hypothetical protein